MKDTIISYEDAQRVIPMLRYLEKEAPISEARKSAARILWDLGPVRGDVDYRLGGYQLFLSSTDYRFLNDIMEQMGLR